MSPTQALAALALLVGVPVLHGLLSALERGIRGPRRDPRVRLLDDSFLYDDQRTPIGWLITYDVQHVDQSTYRGTFALTARKTRVYTRLRPVAVEVVSATPLGETVPPDGHWIPGEKVGGHRRRKDAPPPPPDRPTPVEPITIPPPTPEPVVIPAPSPAVAEPEPEPRDELDEDEELPRLGRNDA